MTNVFLNLNGGLYFSTEDKNIDTDQQCTTIFINWISASKSCDSDIQAITIIEINVPYSTVN